MKGIYLAAGKAIHTNCNCLTYQDLEVKRDLGGDMLSIDLTKYDFIIATPPCNFYSRANYRRLTSIYSLTTFHLLPSIIYKAILLNKPFIIENVRNERLFKMFHLYEVPCFIYEIGRHTYWSNIFLDHQSMPQRQDFKNGGYVIKYDDMDNTYHEGGYNVWQVINQFLIQIGAANCD